MGKPCTAYLIDPFAKPVTSVEWNGDYHHISQLIGADCYDLARINRHGDGVFVDDEGLFKEEQAFFRVAGYPQPLAGKGLILGCDAEGESVAPSITLEDATDLVSFGDMVRLPGGGIGWLETIE